MFLVYAGLCFCEITLQELQDHLTQNHSLLAITGVDRHARTSTTGSVAVV